MQIAPFRGRNIFTGDYLGDGGAFQYYGQAADNIFADNTVERATGVLAWGQWRGWVPANASARPPPLRGQMGNGVMPNLRNQYLRNEFKGSWSAPNYNYSVGYDAFYARRFFAVQPLDDAPPGISGTFALVYRHNSGGGGYSFGAGSSNVVVDGGSFALDPGAVALGGESCVLVARERTELIWASGVGCTLVQ